MKKKLLTLIGFALLLTSCAIQNTVLPAMQNDNGSTREPNIEMHSHTFSSSWAYDELKHWHDSTCEHDAISGCGDHCFGGWVTNSSPTEYKEGIETRECQTCHYKEKRVIGVLEHSHSYSSEWTFDETHHWHVSLCGTDEKNSLEEHVFGEWVEKKEARDEIDGLETRTCEKCGYTERRTIEALPHSHSYSSEWTFDETHHWHDSTCFDETVDGYEEHSLSEWITDYLPSEGSFGRRHKECDVCSFTINDNIYSIQYELDDGTADNPTYYTCDDEITLADASKPGYTFIGWSIEGETITKIKRGTTGNLVISALYSINAHSVIINNEDKTKGDVLGSGVFEYGSSVLLESSPIDGYCANWYIGEHIVSDGDSYCFDMPDEDLSVTVKWIFKEYAITYITNGGSHSNPLKYTMEQEISLKDASKTGYTFTGWTLNGKPITKIEAGTTGELILEANYDINVYSVTITANDYSKGSVSGAGDYAFKTSFRIQAIPKSGCVFAGWYKDNDFYSKAAAITFNSIDSNYSFKAFFLTNAEKTQWDKDHGIVPVVSNNTITYGLYPQTTVTDSSLKAKLETLKNKQSNGWYLCDNEYYSKYSNSWFLCEPISWNILSNSSGRYTLLTTELLDGYNYSTYTGNIEYSRSSIRTYLNGTFYNSAFALSSSKIVTTTVNNSASTTSQSSNPYASDSTQDNVFLLSYKDYLNSSYGFVNSTNETDTRVCSLTEYAAEKGIRPHYSTRSPYYDESRSHIWYVYSESGTMNYGIRYAMTTEVNAFRAAITLNIS